MVDGFLVGGERAAVGEDHLGEVGVVKRVGGGSLRGGGPPPGRDRQRELGGVVWGGVVVEFGVRSRLHLLKVVQPFFDLVVLWWKSACGVCVCVCVQVSCVCACGVCASVHACKLT